MKHYEDYTLKVFVKKLTTRNSRSDIAKVRAIFIWLCSVDLDTIKDVVNPNVRRVTTKSATDRLSQPEQNCNNNNGFAATAELDSPGASSVTCGTPSTEHEVKTEMLMIDYLHMLHKNEINYAFLFAELCRYGLHIDCLCTFFNVGYFIVMCMNKFSNTNSVQIDRLI